MAETFQGHCLPICFMAAGLSTLHIVLSGTASASEGHTQTLYWPSSFLYEGQSVQPSLHLNKVREDLSFSRHERFEEEVVVLSRKDCAIRNHRALDLKFLK